MQKSSQSDNNCKQPTPFCTAYQNEMIGNSYSYNWSINQYNYYEGYGGATHPRKGFSTPRQPAAAPMMMDGNNMNYFAYPMNDFYADVDAATQYIDAVSEGSPQSGWWYAFRHPGRTANILYGWTRRRKETRSRRRFSEFCVYLGA